MKRSLLFLVLMATIGLANATGNTPSNNCNGNGSCSQDTTNNTTTHNAGGNGYGGSATASNVTQNNVTGGAGGSAVIQKGAVQNTVKTDIDLTNKQQQGQIQGQQQGQQQSIKNSGNSSSSIGEGANANSNNVTVQGDTTIVKAPDIPVSTAYAPSIAPTAPCMGSSSGGVQGMSFGISVGSSWTSEECLILETARSFDQGNYREDGLAVRCQAKYAKEAPSCKALAEKTKSKSAALSETKPQLRADKTLNTKVAYAEPFTPVKDVPPTISSGYSVNMNPLTR